MKALIKVVTAGKFTEDQNQILRRVSMVLIEHGFSVSTTYKKKKTLTINRNEIQSFKTVILPRSVRNRTKQTGARLVVNPINANAGNRTRPNIKRSAKI